MICACGILTMSITNLLPKVRRLRDAGLNPGLSMMNGMMSSGNSSQTAGGQTPATVDYNPLAEGF